jgi:hypothetical protein
MPKPFATLTITLPDGSQRDVARGTTPAEIAAAIGPGLAKAAIAAGSMASLRDIMRPLEADAQLALVTARDEKDALELARHDFAHILAEAVQRCSPARRSPSARRPTTASITTSRPRPIAAHSPKRTCRRSRRRCARSSQPTSRSGAKSGAAPI